MQLLSAFDNQIAGMMMHLQVHAAKPGRLISEQELSLGMSLISANS